MTKSDSKFIQFFYGLLVGLPPILPLVIFRFAILEYCPNDEACSRVTKGALEVTLVIFGFFFSMVYYLWSFYGLGNEKSVATERGLVTAVYLSMYIFVLV